MMMRVETALPVALDVDIVTMVSDAAEPLPEFKAGSHVKVGLPGRASPEPSPFSLAGPCSDIRSYQIVVDRQGSGENGLSTWLHEHAKPGLALEVSLPRCGLPLNPTATHHVMIAGGSGVAAFVSALAEAERFNYVELHYAVRNRARAFDTKLLPTARRACVTRYVSEDGQHLSLDRIMRARETSTHFYVCGPPRMIQAAVETASALGISSERLHWDRYGWSPRVRPRDGYAREAAEPVVAPLGTP